MKYVVQFDGGESYEVELDPTRPGQVQVDGQAVDVNVQPTLRGAVVSTPEGKHSTLGLSFEHGELVVTMSDGSREKVRVEEAEVARWRATVQSQPPIKASIVPDEFGAPIAGNLVEILVEDGASVLAGQPFVVIEAMKMFNSISAPKSGTVRFKAEVGQTLRAGDLVATISDEKEPQK